GEGGCMLGGGGGAASPLVRGGAAGAGDARPPPPAPGAPNPARATGGHHCVGAGVDAAAPRLRTAGAPLVSLPLARLPPRAGRAGKVSNTREPRRLSRPAGPARRPRGGRWAHYGTSRGGPHNVPLVWDPVAGHGLGSRRVGVAAGLGAAAARGRRPRRCSRRVARLLRRACRGPGPSA